MQPKLLVALYVKFLMPAAGAAAQMVSPFAEVLNMDASLTQAVESLAGKLKVGVKEMPLGMLLGLKVRSQVHTEPLSSF